jgi:hypothetical protein
MALEIQQGHVMLEGRTPSMRAARHLGLFLEVHEMLHVLLEAKLSPDSFHLWLNEGLAEYFAWRTAQAHAPDALAGFLHERLDELSKLPDDGVIDFLIWSARDGEMMRRMMLPGGESVTLGWSKARHLDDVRRSAEQARMAAGHYEGDRAEELLRSARLWEEWIETASAKRTPNLLPLSSEDDRTRWGVYAALLALFLELDTAGFDPASFIDTLQSPHMSLMQSRLELDANDLFHEVKGLQLTATNAEIVDLLPRVNGISVHELVRRYPVERARRVLEERLSSLPEPAAH